MTDWFAGLGGQQFATAVIWTLAALILLVIVLVVVRLVRSMTFGTFVAGGRNRKTRLAVMDATAVDSHRRLVLVRRDDIEHLLLIGGPTDVVVEREIRLAAGRRNHSVFDTDDDVEAQNHPALPPLPTVPQAPPPRQRAPEPAQLPPLPLRAPAPQQARQPERPQPPRQPERPATPPPRPARQAVARPPVREAPPRTNASRLPQASLPPLPAAMSSGGSRAKPQPTSQNSLDDALLRELQVTFDPTHSPFDESPSDYDAEVASSAYNPDSTTYDPAPSTYKPTRPSYDTAAPPKAPPQPAEMTLDDEMTKLLGELSKR